MLRTVAAAVLALLALLIVAVLAVIALSKRQGSWVRDG
jgi:hypothetical protein